MGLDMIQRLTRSELARQRNSPQDRRNLERLRRNSVKRFQDVDLSELAKFRAEAFAGLIASLDRFPGLLEAQASLPAMIDWAMQFGRIYDRQFFGADYRSLHPYMSFLNILAIAQEPLLLPSFGPAEMRQLRQALPMIFPALAALLRLGFEQEKIALSRSRMGGLEILPKQLLLLSDLEMIRLADATQVYAAIATGRDYYADPHICFFHLTDRMDYRAEFAVAVRDDLGLWSYDRWDSTHVPIGSLRRLKIAVQAAQKISVRRFGILTHKDSERLARWLNLEIQNGKAFLGGRSKRHGFGQ